MARPCKRESSSYALTQRGFLEKIKAMKFETMAEALHALCCCQRCAQVSSGMVGVGRTT